MFCMDGNIISNYPNLILGKVGKVGNGFWQRMWLTDFNGCISILKVERTSSRPKPAPCSVNDKYLTGHDITTGGQK